MRRGHVVLVAAAAALVAAFTLLRRQLGLELHPESMQGAVADMGIWAPLVYVGIVAFRVPLGLPSQLVLVGGGLVFGTMSGTVYGALGLLVSAVFLFFAARYTGREAIVARLPDRLRPGFDLAGTRVGALFMAVGTGYPFGPITMYHLMAGVTGMAFLVFALSVGVGAVVRAATYTFFGSRLLEGDLSGLMEATAVLGAAVVLPLLLPRSRGWLLQALGRRPATADAGPQDLPS